MTRRHGIRSLSFALGLVLLSAAGARAGTTSLAPLSPRTGLTLTIYASADLTFVQETYHLPLQEGLNALQFTWGDQDIDTSSLLLRARRNPELVRVEDTVFPAGQSRTVQWRLRSRQNLEEELEVSYFTRGLHWSTRYRGLLNPENTQLALTSLVTVQNQSGHTYENASLRLILGELHLLEEPAPTAAELKREVKRVAMEAEDRAVATAPPNIHKARVSQYHMFRIEGSHTLPAAHRVTLTLFQPSELPVERYYLWDQGRHGSQVRVCYRWHHGETFPLVAAPVRMFHLTGGQLRYLGEASLDYVAPGQTVKLNLSGARLVSVSRILRDYLRNDTRFSSRGDLVSYQEQETYSLSARNMTGTDIRLHLREVFSPEWDLVDSTPSPAVQEAGAVEFQIELTQDEEVPVTYTLRRRVRVR